MNDMSAVIIAKSDQWNADDFVNGPRTFTIEDVSIRPGTEQPVQIKLAGSNKFFRPCKTASRVLVAAWGADANVYRGRSLTLYTDPSVTWGGMKVGGIRISHLSNITQPLVIALQEKKGSRKMTTVQPLKVAPASADTFTIEAAELALRTAKSLDDLKVEWTGKRMAPFRQQLQGVLDERKGDLSSKTATDTDALIAQFNAANDDDTYNAAKKAYAVLMGSLSDDEREAVDQAQADASERVLA